MNDCGFNAEKRGRELPAFDYRLDHRGVHAVPALETMLFAVVRSENSTQRSRWSEEIHRISL
jgi:hypothetical protein